MFQRWCRLKCNKLYAGGWLSVILCHNVCGSSVPPLLQQVELKYSQSKTLSASFVQIQDHWMTSQKKQTTGQIWIQHPHKIRWETQTPEKNLFISNGTLCWFYTPPFEAGDRGQWIEQKSTEVQSQWMYALLSASFASLVQSGKVRFQQKTPTIWVLTPVQSNTAGTVTEALLHIDLRSKLVQKVILTHLNGNHSEIVLSRVQFGKPLSDSLFRFSVPPGTDRIHSTF